MFIQQRADGGTRLVTSASDLSAASACEFAFLRRVDAKFGRDVVVPLDDDAMLARAARLGDAHEERTLAAYVRQWGEGAPGEPGGVAQIERPASMSEADLLARQEETVRALTGRAEVVFQATFFDGVQRAADGAGAPEIGFVGFADFLRLTPSGAYEVQDTKLARRARVTALMQLAAYAEQLERVGIEPAQEAVLILGDGARSVHRVADVAPVFRSRRQRLHEILIASALRAGPDGLTSSAAPVAWGDAGVWACGRCEVCEPEITRHRDPLLIAGIRRTQRDRLIAAGYTSIDDVAAAGVSAGWVESRGLQAPNAVGEFEPHSCLILEFEVPGISQRVLERIARQAALQLRAESGTLPPVEVAVPEVLGAIPAPNPGDLFFDFEGDPMYREPGGEGARWGLDYLFGMVDANESFTALWAHDLAAEKQALIDFLALVRECRAAYPGMRIYHYAAYERTHLLSIAARHSVGEAEVDQLLREHVLVDLYPIVRQALVVGSRSYSIKKLEPLYMGDELRDEAGVTSAAQSVTEYADAMAALASSRAAERAEGERRLEAIGDYNRYDCVSTLRLRDWLLSLAAVAGVSPYQPSDNDRGDDTGPDLSASAIGEELLELAAAALDRDEPEEAQALRLAASAIDYHQREQKSFWWAHFARLVDPVEEWADTKDVLVVEPALTRIEDEWHKPPRARTERRRLRLAGSIAPGSSLKSGDVYLVYDTPTPFPQIGAAPGARGARRARIVERDGDVIVVDETLAAGSEPFFELPVALTPGPPPPAGAQKGAIEEWGQALAAARRAGTAFPNAVYELLRRDEPTIAGGFAPIDAAPDGAIRALTSSLTRSEHAALAVQGPPGTGKTYLASRVIKRLVEERGWRIGVVGQSHKVVENVLNATVLAGLPMGQVAKVPQGGKLADDAPQPEFAVLPGNGHAEFLRTHEAQGTGCVIGGTAWDFSNEKRFARGSLDLLVVDEAGQFSLAPTIAASVAAERLLLLGDPQQLPQVSQGSHPEPIDESALGWLIAHHDTLPASRGYFLADTRRMRAELADVVSELSYEGKLRAHESAGSREVTGAGPAGLTWHPVEHAGNATYAPEEAAEVVQIARLALAGSLRESGGSPRPLTPDDVIVVAAYNAQVECVSEALAAAGLGGVRVGTVDKFQGQEAVIAIVTLAASSAEDVPRGLDFLLMRNRLNVAISRAQWSAHLVSSSRLGAGLPGNVEGLAALSGYLRLLERAH
ncbi:TM0106 family RecB-like putative nuclease [Leucobacter sp. HY1910]